MAQFYVSFLSLLLREIESLRSKSNVEPCVEYCLVDLGYQSMNLSTHRFSAQFQFKALISNCCLSSLSSSIRSLHIINAVAVAHFTVSTSQLVKLRPAGFSSSTRAPTRKRRSIEYQFHLTNDKKQLNLCTANCVSGSANSHSTHTK